MAGPGGGAPRRSHTKSRKGCDSCKRRHIRCDEGFPQCHNCTKHKVRCPYNDVETPPDLAWTPEIEAAIDSWIETGVFPFPNMGVDPSPDPKSFSKEELRLMYHVAALYDKLAATEAVEFSVWAREIPKILRIGGTHRFVMHGLLALSASHMSHQTGDAAIGKMMLDQSGLAISGFQSAMASSISPESADALLAASNVLSWKVTTWREWIGHSAGSSAITDEIHNNKWPTQFDDIVADSINYPTSPPSPTPDRKVRQPNPTDLEALNLAQTYLVKLEGHLKQKKESPKLVSQLLGFVKAVRKVPSYRSPEEQFERLRSLREWLMWLPVDQLEQNGLKPDLLVIVAHYYAVALIVERLFPEMASVYCASLLIKPTFRAYNTLVQMECQTPGELRGHIELMQFPVQTANEFQARMGCQMSTAYMPSPALSCYETVPVTSLYSSPTFSYSTEDLTVKQEPPTSAVSPLSTSSHFMAPHGGGSSQPHLLNIPSPSYPGGAYSPASTTFESPIAFSDAEDNGLFDLRSLSGSPTAMYETLNSYETPGTFDGLEWDSQHFQSAGFDKLSAHEDFYFTGPQTANMPGSTTPQLPPPNDIAAFYQPVPVPSPYLRPDQFVLPHPESPIHGATSLGHRRHYSSTSSIPIYHLSIADQPSPTPSQ